jgi:hypothetical protein
MHSFPSFIVGATGCLHAIRRTEQPRHVAGKGAHGLETFSIEGSITGCASVDNVPILRGHDRHVHHLERHVQRLEHGSSTTSATYGNGCSGLAGDIRTVGVKGALDDGEQRSVRLAVVHRRTDNEGICLGELAGNAVADIVVEDASAEGLFLALSASDASTDGLVTNPNYLTINAFDGQLLGHFAQGYRCIAVLAGTSVYQENFHKLYRFMLLYKVIYTFKGSDLNFSTQMIGEKRDEEMAAIILYDSFLKNLYEVNRIKVIFALI